MTDNEIIKALEYCRQQGITSECERCKVKRGCRATLVENALDLINRQKAEIEKLQKKFALADECIADVEDALYRGSDNDWASEAIDEYNERIKELTENGD